MRLSSSFYAISLGAAFAVSPAYAQEAPVTGAEDSDAIVVTARKRSETLLQIPESVQAISAETLQRAGIKSVDDLGRQVPNVVLSRRQDNEPNVVIRGVGSFGNTQGIGFYIDDVQNFTDQTAPIQDVERIEVLKGPQGTLYGGSNVGGAIKYVLRKPTEALGAEFSGEYGTFGSYNFYGALNAPLGDTLGIRVSGYYGGSDGYIANTNLGGNADETRDWGTRLALRWRPADDLTVDFSYRHSRNRNGGNVYAAAATSDEYVRQVDFNVPVTNRRTIDGGILQVQYEPGNVAITSLTSYTRKKNFFRWDLDYSSLDAFQVFTGDRDETKVFTQELRLASNGGGPLDWLVGAYFARIEDRDITNSADALIGPDAPLVFGPDAPPPGLIKNFNNGQTLEKQYAFFLTGNYEIGRFKIGGGLRVNRSEFRGSVLNPPAVHTNVNHTLLLPKLTLSYNPNPDVMIFANASLGSEPGRVNVKTGSGSPYRAEKAWNFEAGIKGQTPDRLLSYELVGYYIDYRNRQQETLFIDPATGVIVEEITNIGRSQSYGLEAALRARPTDGLTLSASAGYLHAEWKRAFFGLDDSVTPPAPISVAGNQVPHSPKLTLNASMDFRQPIGNGDMEAGFRADIFHSSSFQWNVYNTGKQSSYELVTLRASLGAADGAWEAALRIENLLNTKHYTEFYPDVFGPGTSLGTPASPRRVLGSVSFKF